MPALFGLSLRDELLTLQREIGGPGGSSSPVLSACASSISEAALDIDTEEDVARMGKGA